MTETTKTGPAGDADPAQARPEPEGWVLVPRTPTETMLAAMRDAAAERTSLGQLRAYRAMIEAAPPAPVEPMRKALEPLASRLRTLTQHLDIDGADEQTPWLTYDELCALDDLLASSSDAVAPRKPLSDEDVERAARAASGDHCDANDGGPHNIIVRPGDRFCSLCGETVKKTNRVSVSAMRAALSTLPVAGGGEVAGLIEEGKAFVAKQPLRIGNELITRLVNALEGRL